MPTVRHQLATITLLFALICAGPASALERCQISSSDQTTTVSVEESELGMFQVVRNGKPFLEQKVLGLVDERGNLHFPSKASLRTCSKYGFVIDLTSPALSATLSVVWSDAETLKFRVRNSSASGGVEVRFSDDGQELYGMWADSGSSPSLGLRGVERRYEPSGEQLGGHVSNVRAPFFFSRAGFGVSFETDASGYMAFGKNGAHALRFNTQSLDYQIYVSQSPRDALQLYNRTHGVMQSPPDWALGEIWWRNEPLKYFDDTSDAQSRVLKDIDELRSHGIPVTAYLLDRPYEDGEFGWGSFQFSDLFPDLAQFFSELEQRDVKLMLWVANLASGPLLEQARPLGILFPQTDRGHWPAFDLREVRSRELLGNGLSRYLELPISGFKIDRGDDGEYPLEVANDQTLRFVDLLTELTQKKPEFFLIARNAHGRAREQTAVWSGDPRRTFEGLRSSVLGGIRTGFINFPIWGSDTGGYLGVPPTDELLARWFAFSAYSPVFEVPIDKHRWSMLRDAPTVYPKLVQKWATRHHELIPYVRSALEENIRSGLPVIRALFFDYPEEEAAWQVTDQYLYGPDLLVAPVLEAGVRAREVYFPSGTWRRLSSSTEYVGPGKFVVPAPLDDIPVFKQVRGCHPG